MVWISEPHMPLWKWQGEEWLSNSRKLHTSCLLFQASHQAGKKVFCFVPGIQRRALDLFLAQL